MSDKCTLEDIAEMPSAAEMMSSKYLSAADVGAIEVVTITRCQRATETFDAGRKDRVNIITITRANGEASQFIACKTNVAAMRVLFGDETKGWIGKRIALVPDEDRMKGETVTCLRISDSPDAPPGRAKAYREAWEHPDGRANGRKNKTSLIARLKFVLAWANARKAVETKATAAG